MTEGRIRAALALVIVTGALAIFAFTEKLDFAQLLAVTGPVTALYFGQYIAKPGEPQEVTVANEEPIAVKATPAKKAVKKR
jgi:hypothetical protein